MWPGLGSEPQISVQSRQFHVKLQAAVSLSSAALTETRHGIQFNQVPPTLHQIGVEISTSRIAQTRTDEIFVTTV